MIKVTNLSKFYGDTKVVNNVSFEVKKGEIFALVGHSGAGKSTLLRCLNGLESYEEGNILIDNVEISSLKNIKLREFRKDIGMIFQHFALMSRKNVYDNVAIPLRFWGYESSYIATKVKDLLELVGLSDKATSYPRELSGGQKQRVAIARALSLEPKILLSDEATSALDPKITKQILGLLKRINKKLGITIVIVTHEMDVVKGIAQRTLLLDKGRILNQGRIEDLFLKPDENMKKFLGYEEILPQDGINIRLFFPKNVAYNCVITDMARTLDIDFNIIWGKIEKLNENVLGNLTINIKEEHKDIVLDYISKTGVLWEVA